MDDYECHRLVISRLMMSGKNNVPPSVSKRVRLYVDFPPTLWITHQLVGVRILLIVKQNKQ